MSIDLLEYVTLTSGEAHISDLPYHKGSVRRVLERMGDVTLFSIEEWNEAGSYLCPSEYKKQVSPHAARRELLRALKCEPKTTFPCRFRRSERAAECV